jgi:transcriptional regulator with XRE-family HTH domain
MVMVMVMERPLTSDTVPPNEARLAKVIRAIRRERGLTQQQVADNWGLTVDGYRPWERPGQRSLKLSQVPGLAKALTVSEDELAERLGIALPDDDALKQLRIDLVAVFGADDAEFLAEAMESLHRRTGQERKDTIRVIRLVTREDGN